MARETYEARVKRGFIALLTPIDYITRGVTSQR